MPPSCTRYQQVARRLQRDHLLAHHTATLPGVAALPGRPLALARMQRFKQRDGPFLLLISSHLVSRLVVRRWVLWHSRTARQWMRRCWPGDTTLLLPAAATAPAAALQRGRIALRMVPDDGSKRLLRRVGGVLYSSSLNRWGAAPKMMSRQQRWRWHRYAWVVLSGECGSGRPSSLVDLCRPTAKVLR